ncbi:extra-large guanine nucleotide-binding protein 3-like [Andrographis paniculata]|uniref:extra-large guanine nucleotide-binding protein 3-like n=1 Tax=Andrographis paniculata TaxID=175694 RepID=UPI0021E79F02|nr:extra-large guanine nucleotide-binding protein 3-like [Andrographis paniculata]
MAAAAGESKGPNPWEELLRKMLPEGAPLPDEDQLDYSISVDYIGPSSVSRPPTNPMIPKTCFSASSKRVPSLSPKNSSWIKSRSSTDPTISENKRNSASSIAFDIVTDDISDDSEAEAETVGDRDESNFSDGSESDAEREVCFQLPHCGWHKGSSVCIRCGKKRGLLGLREACLVCGAEYCMKCVLKGMGSMPEGRKCVGCIGMPVDEARRGRLGKGSRVLARLWSQSQVKEILRVERVCRANQMRAVQLIVNGRELKEKELEELLDCTFPPRDLKPGRYWYDKDSGLWGKEGAKPDTMITSKLAVGGKLRVDASCGNTRVYMNGREITKFELRVLKMANVECTPGTRFWLYEDGSYEEEGQNNIKGHIWEKVSTRLLCSLFSLPIPRETSQGLKEDTACITSAMFHECLEKHRVQTLLLLGLEDSGTSTIFKQAKFIYTNKFTTQELQRIKLTIQRNIIRYLSILLNRLDCLQDTAPLKKEFICLASGRSIPGELKCDGSEQLIYSLNQKIITFCDWLLDVLTTGNVETIFPAAASEYAAVIFEIWSNPVIQEIYSTMEELHHISDAAKYFLDRVIEISSSEYEPSENDILLAEGIYPKNGLACIEFSLDSCSSMSKIYKELNLSKNSYPERYKLLRLGSKGGFKWLEMFGGMGAVVFCVALSDYDEVTTCLAENKMLESRDYFENVVRNSCFDSSPVLLLLTKYDIFEEKVRQVRLTVCEWFRDFDPCPCASKSHNKLHSSSSSSSLAQQAFHYIAMKFKELYSSITGRKLYVYPVRGRERGSVDEMFRYLREILMWDEHGDIYNMTEESD